MHHYFLISFFIFLSHPALTQSLKGYLNIGVTKGFYSVNFIPENNFDRQLIENSNLSPSLGMGLSWNLNKYFSLNTGFQYQKINNSFTMRYSVPFEYQVNLKASQVDFSVLPRITFPLSQSIAASIGLGAGISYYNLSTNSMQLDIDIDTLNIREFNSIFKSKDINPIQPELILEGQLLYSITENSSIGVKFLYQNILHSFYEWEYNYISKSTDFNDQAIIKYKGDLVNLLFSYYYTITSKEKRTDIDYQNSNKAFNFFYLEGNGVAGPLSINYERLIKSHGLYNLTIRSGFGSDFFHGPPEYFIPFSFNNMIGKRNLFLELDLGYLYSTGKLGSSTWYNGHFIYSGIGMRYNKPDGGIFVKVAFYPAIHLNFEEINTYDDSKIGIGVGYAF